MAKVVAIIPARFGSKGVVDKNVKLLAGYPLIAYSIAAARLASRIDRIIVSTDSKEYAGIAEKYGAEVPFLRPAEISGDASTDYDFVIHLLDWVLNNEESMPDYLVHLRPTTPLRDTVLIDKAIDCIKKNPAATALRSVHEMSESAYKAFETENGYLKCICSRSSDVDAANRARQAYERTYQANGYVDIIKTAYVLENNKLHGDNVLAFVTPCVVEIDTLSDFDYLEYQVAKDPTVVDRFFP